MSRKSGKEKFMLYGGPFDRQTVKLSASLSRAQFIGVTATLMFAVKDQIGQYINGRWKPYENPAVLNPNIVLGEM
jgi:hypothetical protein